MNVENSDRNQENEESEEISCGTENGLGTGSGGNWKYLGEVSCGMDLEDLRSG